MINDIRNNTKNERREQTGLHENYLEMKWLIPPQKYCASQRIPKGY